MDAAGPDLISEDGLYEQIEAACPRCGTSFAARPLVAYLEDPVGEDLDFRPNDAALPPFEAHLVVCPACTLALTPDVFSAPLPEEDAELLRRLQLPSEGPGWARAFQSALMAAETLGYPVSSLAFLALEAAWAARQHGDAGQELVFLATALDLFERGIREGAFTGAAYATAQVIAAECSRRLGIFSGAELHLAAAEAERTLEPELVDRVAAIRAAARSRDLAARTYRAA